MSRVLVNNTLILSYCEGQALGSDGLTVGVQFVINLHNVARHVS